MFPAGGGENSTTRSLDRQIDEDRATELDVGDDEKGNRNWCRVFRVELSIYFSVSGIDIR